jgi:hypothetical protein
MQCAKNLIFYKFTTLKGYRDRITGIEVRTEVRTGIEVRGKGQFWVGVSLGVRIGVSLG